MLYQLWFICLFNVFLNLRILAVDRGNFKTCKQSSFCRRNRAVQPGNSNYDALLNTVKVKEEFVTVDIINKKNNVKFFMEIHPLEDSTFRLKFNEKNPIYSRFEEPYSLLDTIKSTKFQLDRNENGFKVTAGDSVAVIRASPLRVDFYKGNSLAVSFNAKGLLKFEHYRKKQVPEAVAEPEEQQDQQESNVPESEGNQEIPQQERDAVEFQHEDAADPQQDAAPQEPVGGDEEETDTDGLWEETFKGHTDTKPRGPSSLGVDVVFHDSQSVYGIPEHADSFKLKNTDSGDPYRLYNLDVFEYELDSPMALYGSVPVMLSHSKSTTTGIFWHNAAETWIDVKYLPDRNVVSTLTGLFSNNKEEDPHVSTHWMSESGIIDLFVMLGNRPMDVFRQYARLTGTTPLPPIFSLGYHQCRWNYHDEADLLDVHSKFDLHNIPVDVLWLDIEHTDGKRYFTWDSHKFPNPIDMTYKLVAKGRRLVVIVDPHIKKDSNYFFYEENRVNGYYIKNKDGEDFDGWCWPGSSAYIDFTNVNACEHYINTFSLDIFKGSTHYTYIWNDMNEPSVFNGPEVTLHKDAIHKGINVEHRHLHNVNGMIFHEATHRGLVKRSGGKLRPFVLTRAHFAGSQRSAAVWTGDNTADWGHLRISVPMILSQSVVGITHIGADIGGFFGNPEPELLSRWYQAAAFTTFFRAHAHIDTKRREPWLFGEPFLAIIREAIRDHYRLLPYIYTLFYENERIGAPPARPLWVEFPSDEAVFDVDYEYLLGPALLVRPVVENGQQSASVYFPDGTWIDWKTLDFFTGPSTQTVAAPLTKIPVYQRGGTIIPRKERARRSATLMRNDPVTLFVFPSEEGTAEGVLYLDDEASFEYQQGKFLYIRLSFENNLLTSEILDPHGSYETKVWVERVVIYGLKKAPRKVKLQSGMEGTVMLESEFTPWKDRVASSLVIRKPGVNVASPFTIQLLPEADGSR